MGSLCLSSVQLKPLIIYLMMKYLTVAVLISLSGIGLADIAQVKYLGGITFLLKDRCPDNAESSRVERYEQCAANEILHTQCVTDSLKTGDKLTVPVFTDICSAVCWGENVQTSMTVHIMVGGW